MVTWYEHARRYAEAKWAGLAPVSRRSVAEALVTVTIALTAKEKGAPEGRVLRQALFGWAFNPATREQDPPREIAAALGWVARASLSVSALDDPATVRLALGACGKTLAGKPAAGSTQRRKRSVFYNALGYAVEHDYRELKTGLGLDHFEGRSWTGWHRHVTLATLAQAFITMLRSDPKAPAPG